MSKSPKKSKSLTRAGNRPATISAQQTIPYVRMLPDGICQLPGGVYTKTLEYEDINYSVASAEDQTAIFGGWSAWLNYFDSSLPFQLSFVNRRSRSGSRYKVNISEADDRFNSVRTEYTGMLKNQIAKSNNGIERAKYVTFCIPAENVAAARPRLERVEADVIGNFKRLGVQSQPLDGRERLALLHGQLHPGSREPFRFKWADIAHTGMGTKDFIVPDSFDFRQSRSFRVGQTWGAASYLQIMASELSDKLLLEILELDAELTVTMHIQTVDQVKAIKTVKGKISDIDKMKVEEQRKATRAGYDPDILPPDLVTFSKDAAELLADLQSRNERMFLLTFLIVNTAPTRERLENDIFTVNGIAQKYNCAVKRLDWQQEQGYMSSLALGYNGIEIQRGMTTSSTAIFVPFMTRELRMDGPSLYYGMNALSHNVIMADRKKLKSANGLYLGSTGSGKSFAAKRELLNVFLAIPQDRIIVVDPMGEYAPLVERLGGQVIEIAPDSPNHISPMDVQMDMGSGDSPLSLKADFLLSLCELVVGGRDGLQPIEKTVIDRCVRQVYREMALGLETTKTPLLQDLYEELLRQPEPEAKRIATALELYCTGSLNLFNHPTNVNLNSRVVCFVLKGMGENLRKIAMHITNDFVTSAVGTNFKNGVATWCYFDEFHILLRDPLTASYFVAVWKMLRKKGCVPSALTQNVKDLLASREIENILDNTDFMILLSQAQSDRTILAKQLGISEHQLSYITHSNSGEGLLFYMTEQGFKGFQRGEYGSTAEHLTSLQYQIKQDKERLDKLQQRIEKVQVKYEPARHISKTLGEIEGIGQKTITGKVAMSKEDYAQLTALAKEGVTSRGEIGKLQDNVRYYQQRYYDSATALERMNNRYNDLKEKCKPFLEALEHFPEVAKLFVEKVRQLFSIKEAQKQAEKEAKEKARQERIKARRNKRGMER